MRKVLFTLIGVLGMCVGLTLNMNDTVHAANPVVVDYAVSATYTGWVSNSDGTNSYYIDGEMVCSEVIEIGNKYYGFNASGVMYSDVAFSIDVTNFYRAKEDGTLTTELKELYVPEIFKISVSPKPNKDKKHLISASIYRTRDEIKEVFCLLPKNQKLTLKKVSPWQYIGYFKPNSSKENFTVTAKFASGKNATKKYYYKPQKKENSPFILRQVLSVPGTVYFGQPLVENNILYIAFEDESNYKNGGIAAFSLNDGEKIWQYTHGRSIRGRLTISQGNLYAADSFGYRIKLDSKTGKLLENKAPKVLTLTMLVFTLLVII